MPLKYKKEPRDVMHVVKNQFEKIRSGKGFRTPLLASIQFRRDTANLDQKQAVPVYHLGLDDLKEKKDISTAKHIGWRYLVKHKGKEVASADAVIDDDGSTTFSHINEGALVSGLVSAIKVANSEEIIRKSDFEARIIMVPALYIAALWLADTAGGKDYAIPFEPSSAPVTTNKLVTIERLMAILHRLAQTHSA